jgi:hypothetical protein
VGCRLPLTNPTAIWCGYAKRRKTSSFGYRHRFRNSCCATANAPPTQGKPGLRSTGTRSGFTCISISRHWKPSSRITAREGVDSIAERITKLEQAIDEAVKQAPPELRVVSEALQALRGAAQTTAATVVAELGSRSRFAHPSQLMG